MGSELWRRQRRPIPAVGHVLTTAAPCLLPEPRGLTERRVNLKCGVGYARRHVVMETPEAPSGPIRRIRCLMSPGQCQTYGREDDRNDATNARLVSHQEGTHTLERYYRIWNRRRGSSRTPSGTHGITRCVAWIQSCGDANAGPFLP